MKFNWYFYKIWLPVHILFVCACVGIFYNIVQVNWLLVFLFWVLVGPIGNGVGFHRLFSHRQFETWRPIELSLAILGTLSTYSPLLFWVGTHQTHHRLADSFKDIQSPSHHTFWESFMSWKFRTGLEKTFSLRDYCTRQCLRDPSLIAIDKYTVLIIWSWALFLFVISPSILVSVFVFPAFIEHTRVNLTNYAGHKSKLPFNYRNINSDDSSQNNLLLGWLGFGMGWHNNHHANERELVNTHNWWEIDLEGQIAKIITRKKTNEK